MRREIRPSRGRGRGTGLRLMALLLAMSLAAAPLLAQEPPENRSPSPPDPRSLGLPSEKTAFALSLAGTLGSWGLLLLYSGTSSESGGVSEAASALGYVATAGVFVGPSLGDFYGGCWGRGLLLSGLRLGAAAALLAYSLEHDEEDLSGAGLALLGGVVGLSIYECATVKSAVRKHNAARMAKRGVSLAVAPLALRKGGGLQVRLSF